jgi:hypothetical protein
MTMRHMIQLSRIMMSIAKTCKICTSYDFYCIVLLFISNTCISKDVFYLLVLLLILYIIMY